MLRHGWWAVVPAALRLLPLALAGVHEQRAGPPLGWSATGSTDSNMPATFTVVLQQDFDGLEALLLEVSTPGSPKYGQYLSKQQADELFKPPDEAVSKVLTWLGERAITEYRIDGAFIDFTIDISTANALFDASYQFYESNGVTKLRAMEYSLPDEIQNLIALVDPGTYFGTMDLTQPILEEDGAPATVTRRQGGPSPARIDAACATGITPSCAKQMYNVGNYTADASSGSRVGFGSFLNQSALYSDLFLFEDMFGIPRQNFSVEAVANGTNNQDPNTADMGEANLDVQNIIAVSHPLPVVEFSTGGSPPFIPTLGQPTPDQNYNEPYVPYCRYLLSKENADLPQVVSISYGDQEDGVPLNYAQLTCSLIGQLALRGQTTLVSSGDGGVGGGCLAPDMKTTEFIAAFPATCPYVTAVGGTSFAANTTDVVAWNRSSGGFSRYFERPSWQERAVGGYLADHVAADTKAYYGPFANGFRGRAFPDVAAHSLFPAWRGLYAGNVSGNGGTSAASPAFAGIVGLLNDARLRAGRPVLGWLNPLLYGAGGNGTGGFAGLGADVMVDVVNGFTVGCLPPGTNGSGVVLGARWNATKGWDPATGWGVPDFEKMRSAVLAL